MPAPPLVTVVVNNFNYARFLTRSIDSALAQTHARTEVVVVDDASSDGSQDVIRRYGGSITAVLRDANGGQAAAFHSGFERSRGDVVIFLDSDDYLYPHAAERVAAAFEPGVAKVQYRLHLVDAEGKTIDLYPAPEIWFDSGDVTPLLLSKGRYETPVTSGNAFARSVLASILPMPEEEFRISADGYLVTLAPLLGRVVSLDEPLGGYTQHGGSYSIFSSVPAGERFRRYLEHDLYRYRALAGKASELGLDLSPEPGLRDHQHLASRIASLCLDPGNHPFPSDRRRALGVHGAKACGTANLPRRRRAILAAWFLAVGLLPRALAQHAVAWRLVKGSRPPAVDRALKALRRATG